MDRNATSIDKILVLSTTKNSSTSSFSNYPSFIQEVATRTKRSVKIANDPNCFAKCSLEMSDLIVESMGENSIFARGNDSYPLEPSKWLQGWTSTLAEKFCIKAYMPSRDCFMDCTLDGHIILKLMDYVCIKKYEVFKTYATCLSQVLTTSAYSDCKFESDQLAKVTHSSVAPKFYVSHINEICDALKNWAQCTQENLTVLCDKTASQFVNELYLKNIDLLEWVVDLSDISDPENVSSSAQDKNLDSCRDFRLWTVTASDMTYRSSLGSGNRSATFSKSTTNNCFGRCTNSYTAKDLTDDFATDTFSFPSFDVNFRFVGWLNNWTLDSIGKFCSDTYLPSKDCLKTCPNDGRFTTNLTLANFMFIDRICVDKMTEAKKFGQCILATARSSNELECRMQADTLLAHSLKLTGNVKEFVAPNFVAIMENTCSAYFNWSVCFDTQITSKCDPNAANLLKSLYLQNTVAFEWLNNLSMTSSTSP
uniref:Uncharacterized protein n=1 Tax=Romanomermis culicivorax TaxID=13658 RepID=A0A915K8K6_ROMCU